MSTQVVPLSHFAPISSGPVLAYSHPKADVTLMISKSVARDILAKTAVSLSLFLRINITIIVSVE